MKFNDNLDLRIGEDEEYKSSEQCNDNLDLRIGEDEEYKTRQ